MQLTHSQLKQEFKRQGHFGLWWCLDDIILRGEERDIEVTKKEAQEIAEWIENSCGADVGINWEVIDNYTDEFKRES